MMLTIPTAPLLLLALAAQPAQPPAAGPTTAPTSPTSPTTGPATQPADAQTLLNDAIEALRKELAEMQSLDDLRKQSDYFDRQQAEAIDPATLLRALESRLSDAPAADSYIKWQLLSAQPGRFPVELGDRAVRAFAGSAAPLHRPGVTPEQQLVLRRNLEGATAGDVGRLQAEWDALVERETRGNDQILAYRELLFDRLPDGFPSFAAGLVAAEQMSDAGIPGQPMSEAVVRRARVWAETGDATPAELRRLAGVMEEYEDEGPLVITGIEFNGNATFAMNEALVAYEDFFEDAAEEMRRRALTVSQRGPAR